ncbi:MAG: hypothetical protein LLG37_05985 [Spirochaetia bacterium]|nr:hypothetical protein [Spirochaetia bacterium]
MKKIVIVLLFIPVAAIMYSSVGNKKFHDESALIAAEMRRGTERRSGEVITENDLKGLPGPAADFFRFSGVVGKKRISYAGISYEGSCLYKEGNPPVPVSGEYFFATVKPGFVRDIKFRIFPGFYAMATDSYSGGKGRLLTGGPGGFTIAESSGPEVTHGLFMRYLSDALLVPTSLLPSSSVRWEKSAGNTASVWLSDSGQNGAAIVKFNNDGSIDNVLMLRYRSGNDGYKLEKWSGKYADYTNIDGFRVPGYMETAWIVLDGHMREKTVPCEKFIIKQAHYEY